MHLAILLQIVIHSCFCIEDTGSPPREVINRTRRHNTVIPDANRLYYESSPPSGSQLTAAYTSDTQGTGADSVKSLSSKLINDIPQRFTYLHTNNTAITSSKYPNHYGDAQQVEVKIQDVDSFPQELNILGNDDDANGIIHSIRKIRNSDSVKDKNNFEEDEKYSISKNVQIIKINPQYTILNPTPDEETPIIAANSDFNHLIAGTNIGVIDHSVTIAPLPNNPPIVDETRSQNDFPNVHLIDNNLSIDQIPIEYKYSSGVKRQTNKEEAEEVEKEVTSLIETEQIGSPKLATPQLTPEQLQMYYAVIHNQIVQNSPQLLQSLKKEEATSSIYSPQHPQILPHIPIITPILHPILHPIVSGRAVPNLNRFNLLGNETEIEKAERRSRTYENMIHFVNVLGQVDSFISDQAKKVVRTFARFYDDDEDDRRYRRRNRHIRT